MGVSQSRISTSSFLSNWPEYVRYFPGLADTGITRTTPRVNICCRFQLQDDGPWLEYVSYRAFSVYIPWLQIAKKFLRQRRSYGAAYSCQSLFFCESA